MARHSRRGPDRRKAPRLPSNVYYSGDRVEGEGLLHDLSLNGARVATGSPQPKSGSEVLLHLSIGEDGIRIRVRAEVVRQVEDGFAVRFLNVDPRLQSVLIAAGPAASRLTKTK